MTGQKDAPIKTLLENNRRIIAKEYSKRTTPVYLFALNYAQQAKKKKKSQNPRLHEKNEDKKRETGFK